MCERQCSSRAAAEKEVAERKKAGYTTTGPSSTVTPSGRVLWSYTSNRWDEVTERFI